MNKQIMQGSYGGATASADMVRMLFTYLEFQKVDTGMLEAVAGIDRFQLDRRIPVTTVNRLWQAAREASGDPDFGVHLGEAFIHLAQGHLLFSVMRYSPTLGAALEKLFRFHCLMTDIVQPRAITENDTVHCLLNRKYPNLPLARQQVEATFTIIFGSLNVLSAKPFSLEEVAFCFERPASTAELKRVFDVPLSFGCREDRLVLRKESLEYPIRSADPAYLLAHESLAEDLMNGLSGGEEVASKVAGLVERTILKGEPPRIAVVARQLAVSVRKLQLSLQEEGINFRDIANHTRKRLAKRFLRQPNTTICDVAFLLGFSEQSAFNHAFRRWTGRTPRQYREG
jgi:AraC-like DNA-binding protein